MANISMDPEVVLGCLKYRDLRYLLNDNKGNYSMEELIHPNYICGVFDAFNEVSDYWVNLVNQIRDFVQEFDSIPEPNFETNINELDFLDYNASVATQGGKLNIRADASGTASILGQLSNGTKVEIIGDEAVNGFYQVEYLDEKGVAHRGYVSEKFVNKDGGNATLTEDVSKSIEPTHEEVIQTNTQAEKEQPIVVDIPIEQTEKEQPVVVDIPLESNEPSNSLEERYVNTDKGNLNFREAPGTDSKIIDRLPKDSKVTILGQEDKNGWVKVSVGDQEGYVKSSYLTSKSSNDFKSITQDIKYVNTKNANGHLNIRTEPSASTGKVIDMLDNKAEVKVLGTEGDWYKISHNGQVGYVNSKYIKDTK